jgi:hypothetical protein
VGRRTLERLLGVTLRDSDFADVDGERSTYPDSWDAVVEPADA